MANKVVFTSEKPDVFLNRFDIGNWLWFWNDFNSVLRFCYNIIRRYVRKSLSSREEKNEHKDKLEFFSLHCKIVNALN